MHWALWARSNPLPAFINKTLGSQALSSPSWLLLWCQSREEPLQQRPQWTRRENLLSPAIHTVYSMAARALSLPWWTAPGLLCSLSNISFAQHASPQPGQVRSQPKTIHTGALWLVLPSLPSLLKYIMTLMSSWLCSNWACPSSTTFSIFAKLRHRF